MKSSKANMFTNLLKQFMLVILTLLLITFSAVLSGTLLWLIWPIVVKGVFPGLIGIVSPNISWIQAVCTTWVFSILFKASTTQNSKCPCEEEKK